MRRGVALSLSLSLLSAAIAGTAATATATASASSDHSVDVSFPSDRDVPPTTDATPPSGPSGPSLTWTDCWFDATVASTAAFECATLNVPVCYADSAPCSLGNTRTHALRALRRQATKRGSATDGPTVWVVSESNDDGTTADFMERLAQSLGTVAVTMYALQSRLWNPPTSDTYDSRNERTPCATLAIDYGARVDVDNATVDAATNCSQWLVKTFGTNATNAYALDSAARDLAAALQLVQAQELSTTNANPNVYVLAMGKASRVVQRFIALNQSTSSSVSVAGYIFDTPHAMKLSPTDDAIAGVAASRFLDGCDADAVCRSKFNNVSLSMRDVLTKLEVAVDASTPPASRCIALLKNASFVDSRDQKPSHGLRRYIAALRRHAIGIKYTAPLLFRAHRCIGTDEAGVQELVARVATFGISWGPTSSLALFAERVVAYSELWPMTPLPLRDTLVQSFETAPVSDGAMALELPSFCLFTASDAAACQVVYRPNIETNASLVLSYVPSKAALRANATTGLVGGPADVLILTSRLHPSGSASVARNLLEAFVGRPTAVLIESDNVGDTELEGGGDGTDTLVSVLALFITKRATPLRGTWRVEDLYQTSTVDLAKAAPATSTYDASTASATRTVSVDWTMTVGELAPMGALTMNDVYENALPMAARTQPPSGWGRYTISPSYTGGGDGTPSGYYVLAFGGLLLLMVGMMWARKQRDDKEIAAFVAEPPAPQPPQPPQPAVHVNVNVVINGPSTNSNGPYEPYDPYGAPLVPHAIPVVQLPPQHPRSQQTQTPRPVLPRPAQRQPPVAPATQWVAEPVNEYAYSYTAAGVARSARSRLSPTRPGR